MRMKNLSAIYRSFQARILIIKLVNGVADRGGAMEK